MRHALRFVAAALVACSGAAARAADEIQLAPPAVSTGDPFGQAAAADGGTVVVGAPLHAQDASDAGSAAAGTIDDVQPREVGLGDLLTITGSGLDLPGGVKASIRWWGTGIWTQNPFVAQVLRLEVVDATATTVTVRVVKGIERRRRIWLASAGTEVVLQARQGRAAVVGPAPDIRFHGPEPERGAPVTAAPGDSVTIAGAWFGEPPGTVRIGGRPAPVVSWSRETVVVMVPAGLGGGVYGAVVGNRFGAGVVPTLVMVPGPPRPRLTKAGFACTVGRRHHWFAKSGAGVGETSLWLDAMVRRDPRTRDLWNFACFWTLGICELPQVETVTTYGFHVRLPFDPAAGPGQVVIRAADTPHSEAAIWFESKTKGLENQDWTSSVLEWTVVLTQEPGGDVRGEFAGVDERMGRPIWGQFLVRAAR